MSTPATPALARQAEALFDRLWPLCRSLAGPGYRQSLALLQEIVPFTPLCFASGERVLDWQVPPEWHPHQAWIVDPHGRKRADFAVHNLHLVGYSVPFRGRLSLAELRPHLYSLPDQPNAIPYITSYYRPRWGFCLTHEELTSLPEGDYEVVVDTELKPGELVVGEAVLPGHTEREILVSTYLCHPSLANNELSGPVVQALVYQLLQARAPLRHTVRFAIMPETVGSICYLARRGAHFQQHLTAGLQLTCIGDAGQFTYKSSRRGDAPMDRAARLLLTEQGPWRHFPFNPYLGSDERQYCSPGFNLPVGTLCRTIYRAYPEYHTSLDNKSLMDFAGMVTAAELIVRLIQAVDGNRYYVNQAPYGEPQLGPRGLYDSFGAKPLDDYHQALFWLLNLADGQHDLLAIAERSGVSLELFDAVIPRAMAAGLLTAHDQPGAPLPPLPPAPV